VVNIDNGFGAAYFATMILQRIHRPGTQSAVLAGEAHNR
jgi:hypothetical protein